MAVASSGVVEIITLETETWLKLRDRDFIKNSGTRDLKFETETRDFKICAFFSEFLLKNFVITSKMNFFKFLSFVRDVVVVSSL